MCLLPFTFLLHYYHSDSQCHSHSTAIGCVTPVQSDPSTKVRAQFQRDYAIIGDKVQLQCTLAQITDEYTCTRGGVWISRRDLTRIRHPKCIVQSSPSNNVDRMGVGKDGQSNDLDKYAVVRGMGK